MLRVVDHSREFDLAFYEEEGDSKALRPVLAFDLAPSISGWLYGISDKCEDVYMQVLIKYRGC